VYLRVFAALFVVAALGCNNAERTSDRAPAESASTRQPLAVQVAKPEAPAPQIVRTAVSVDALPQKDLAHTNILLITVDALRPDHLGCYGYPKPTSPNIDALAKDGVVFEHAMAPKGSTWPSLASILTGLYPVTHGVRYNGMNLDSKHDTLAEMVAPAGYTSAVFIANGGNQRWEGFEPRVPIKEEPRDPNLTNAALPWLDENADKKFFLWLHYFSPHGPYDPPKEFDTFTDPSYDGTIDGSYEMLTRVFVRQQDLSPADVAHVKGLYDGDISITDVEIGRVVEKVASLGLLNDTLIVISADHGEELYDHHKYFHHQASLYEGTLKVPLIIRLPGVVPAGKRVSQPVSHTDIVPTILELTGLPIPSNLHGMSLVPAWGDGTFERGPVFGEWGDKMLVIRTAQHKYIYNPSGFEPPVKRERNEVDPSVQRKNDHSIPMKKQELYEVLTDPKELKELSETSAEVISGLEQQLKAGYQDKWGWKLENKAEEKLQNELDDETRKELEAMGYVI